MNSTEIDNQINGKYNIFFLIKILFLVKVKSFSLFNFLSLSLSLCIKLTRFLINFLESFFT